MSKAIPRIMGTEVEFGLSVYDTEDQPATFMQSELHAALPDNVRVVGEFLSNGSRLYIDWNDKLEYSTPECKSVADVVQAEIAGEQIVFSCLDKMIGDGLITRFELNKRVIDDHSNTWGYHESYMLRRELFEDKRNQLVALQIAQLLSRTILSGAGRWTYMDDDPTFIAPAQKLQGIESMASAETTVRKPIVNLRDSSYTESNFARLHTTCGDANILPWASWMKIGTTSLALRLLETNTLDLDMLALDQPVAAAHQVAVDASGKELLFLESGKNTSALGLQRELLSQCQKLTDIIVLTKEENALLSEWQWALDAFTDDPSKLIGKVDWVTRGHIIKNYYATKCTDKNNEAKVISRLSQVDLLWDNLDPVRGIGIKHFRDQGTFPGYNPQYVESLARNSPSGTRAHQRASLIRSIPHEGAEEAEISWTNVTWNDDEYTYEVDLSDPYGRKKSVTRRKER